MTKRSDEKMYSSDLFYTVFVFNIKRFKSFEPSKQYLYFGEEQGEASTSTFFLSAHSLGLQLLLLLQNRSNNNIVH